MIKRLRSIFNRLWVRLSLAFSAVVLLSALSIFAIGRVVSQIDPQQEPMVNYSFTVADGLFDNLAAYFRLHKSWTGVETMLAGAESVFPPGPHGRWVFVFADAQGHVLYDPHLEDTSPQFVLKENSIPVEVDGQVQGYLSIYRKPTIGKPPPWMEWITDLVLLIALVGGSLGLIFGVLVSRSLSAPLSRLAAAAQAIGERKLNRRVEAKGTTEIVAVATAFNEMATALEKAETLRRNMVADVAHELRTPLTVLQGNLRAILDGVYPMDRSEVARLYDQTRVLSRLVNDLHELTLAEAQQLPLNMQPTNINDVIETVADTFGPIAEAEEVKLNVQMGQKIPAVLGDSMRMTQVLHNLLGNALHHTPGGGEISLSTEPLGTGVNITIRDTGEGIPPEHLPHIFERFYRGDRARSRATGGAGLGLAIVHAIIVAHGGSVIADSDGISGHGTIFKIWLPACSQQNPASLPLQRVQPQRI